MYKLIILIIILTSCDQQAQPDISAQSKQEMMEADIAMSNLAAKEGFFKALLTYAEDSVIIPRDGKLPLMSKSEAETAWQTKPVIKEISWSPVRGEVSESGHMGFTFGYSTYKGTDTVTYTNYCTIWRKQKDGTWKFVYDGGNNIPGPLE